MSTEATSPEHHAAASSETTTAATTPSHMKMQQTTAAATATTSSIAGGAEQQQVPFQMIPPGAHFFANPFMNPYLPSPDVSTWQAPQHSADPSADPSSNAANPNQMPAMMISPAQYQEMMQHYFQQMMAASGAQFPIPFPMQFQPFQSNQRPSSQCSSSQKSEDDGGRRTAGSNASPNRRETTSNGVTTETEAPPPQEIITAPTQRDEEPDLIGDATSSVPVEASENVVEVQEESASSSPPTEEKVLTDGKRKLSGESTTDRADTFMRKQMSEIEKEITRRSQNKNIKKIDDNELAELIGTSMGTVTASTSDIDEAFGPYTEKSALPYSAASSSVANSNSAEKAPAVKESLNQLRSSFNLPDDSSTTSISPSHIQPSQQPQLQNHQFATSSMFTTPPNGGTISPQNPFGVTMPQQSPYSTTPSFAMMPQQHHNMFMQQQPTNFINNGTNPFASALPQLNPSFVQQNGIPQQPTSQTSSQNFSPEQLAAFFAQQQIQQHAQHAIFDPISMTMSTEPSTSTAQPPSSSSTTSGIAPPPPPSHPIPRRSGWPEENKENGTNSVPTTNGAPPSVDDPVWVLRDSYLKKMQREQRHSADEELNWHEAATAAQEAAENGGGEEEEQETDRLLNGANGANGTTTKTSSTPADRRGSVDKKKNSKETMVHEPAVLIEGVLFRARYLGSTQMLCESRGSKAARMAQAQEAVARVKAPDGDVQPSTEIDLFISTEKIMVLNTDLQRISDTDVRQDILMDHALRTISYIADIGDLVVLMARRMSTSHSDESCSDSEGSSVRKTPKVICHVFESDEASFIAQSIGQAFQVAYVEFLRANGIDDPSYLRQIDYQEVLNSQELLGDELEMFAKKETQKEVVVPKKAGELLGIVVVESGWGSMLPTVVLAHMNPIGPAAHSNKLNIGDQIININGISLVGLPLSAAQTQIKNTKTATAVRMTVVSTPPVVEVRIRRPDTKYQLGFSVQNGVICSLLRGGIAERGGIRVGHRIIEINGSSVVAVAHDRIVNMLATAVGEIHMKTMPTSMFRLLTGQESPQYI